MDKYIVEFIDTIEVKKFVVVEADNEENAKEVFNSCKEGLADVIQSKNLLTEVLRAYKLTNDA